MGPKLAILFHKNTEMAITLKPTPIIERDSQTKERGLGRGHATMLQFYLSL